MREARERKASIFFQPWWGSTYFGKSSSSVLQRCSSFFLLLPSSLSPRLLSSPLGLMQPPALTTHSVALALLTMVQELLLSLLLKRLSSNNSTWQPNLPFLLSQVLMFMLLLRMPSLLGWEFPLGSLHTWLLRKS